MKKILITLCVSIVIHVLSSAQSAPTYLNNYVQPAPNAASLGKFADYPVSYYTGVPQISVPLYTIKDGGITMPLSLSYHASGIHVSEMASWVGLGWALNCGGVIVRTVRGTPDEGTRQHGWGWSGGAFGYYNSYGITHLPILNHPDSHGYIVNDDTSYMMDLVTDGIGQGNLDGEPDLYTFNFNGHTGKFVFDENRTPRLLEDDNLRIVVNYDGQQFTSWVITTPDGIKYYFGENSTYEVTNPHSTVSGDDLNSEAPSSWYLTKIINPNTKDTAFLRYASETYSYRDLGVESSQYPNMSGSPGYQHYVDYNQACDNSTIQINLITTAITGLRLKSIKTTNDSIAFIALNVRQDLLSYDAGSYPYRLDSIKVYNNGQCIQQNFLNYSYFTSVANSTYQTVLDRLSFYSNDSTDAKRLKLLSVTEYSGDKSINKPSYVFSYQEAFRLPRRLSYGQDHWGFCNDSIGTSNHFFTPPVTHGICVNGGTGADRNAHWPDMSAFTLISVKDPLGVVDSFQYEANTAINLYGTNTVGGLRIKQISTKDYVTGTAQVRSYTYNGGIIYRMPKYLQIPSNEYFRTSPVPGATSYQGYTAWDPLIRGILKQSASVVPLQDPQGNHIGYSFVTETFGPFGEGGYKVYNFQIDQSSSGNSRLDISNYMAVQSVATGYGTTITGYYGNDQFNQIQPQNLQYYSGYDVDKLYPAAPPQIDLRRGRLLSEKIYDSSGVLLQNTENIYNETYHEDYSIRGFKAASTYTIAPSAGPGGTPQSIQWKGLCYYKLHTGISHLISTVTTNYKDGKIMTDTTRFGYESAYHNLKTSDTSVNSLGDSIIKKTYYSFDYNATANSVFTKMNARNLLLPVSSQVWKNNKLMSGTITLYKDFATGSDTLINPQKIYALDVSNTLTTSQAGESIKLTGQLSTLVPNSYFTEKASFNCDGTTGKMIEQNLTSDKTQALIWDDKLSLPLAVVDNAKEVDIAYNSFESAETGNWTYTASYVTAVSSAPTGGKVYTLNSTTPLSKTGLTASKKYILSYWIKSGGSLSISGGTQSNNITGSTVNTTWTYNQVTITTTGTTLNITGSGYIDEVRLYPATAQMVTYTYDAMMRLLNQCSANSTISEYEYDALNRLTDIKDQQGNVLKAFEYNYGASSR